MGLVRPRGRLHAMVLMPALMMVALMLHHAQHPTEARPPTPAPPPASASPATTAPLAPPAGRPATPATTAPGMGSPLPEAPRRQGSTVSGILVDEVTGKPIVGAEVSLPELGTQVRSGQAGRWTLEGVPPRARSYELLVTCPGYSSVTAEVTVHPTEGLVAIPAIQLKPKGW
ncbi:MAG: carboxypeptidase regulatory-like domain-containing protein [Candidatus Riflebacteria bacterium]|nr:carboxypeptidase regulatory-like domain-containing protein [Candidatus Riflebacteria bacterium]